MRQKELTIVGLIPGCAEVVTKGIESEENESARGRLGIHFFRTLLLALAINPKSETCVQDASTITAMKIVVEVGLAIVAGAIGKKAAIEERAIEIANAIRNEKKSATESEGSVVNRQKLSIKTKNASVEEMAYRNDQKRITY